MTTALTTGQLTPEMRQQFLNLSQPQQQAVLNRLPNSLSAAMLRMSAPTINAQPLAQPMQQPMAQPMAQGQGPSFQFQDLNRAFQLDPRNTLSNALLQQGMRGGPVRTPLEGIGRLSQSLVGAMLQKRALDRLEGQETTRQENLQTNRASILGNITNPEVRNTISALLPAQATEASNTQLANVILGSALAPTQEIKPITNIEGMTGAKVVSTGPLGDQSISSVNLAALPKEQETFTTLTKEQADAQGFDTSKGQTYQQSNLTDKVTQIGGGGSTINLNTSKAGEEIQKELVADYKKLQSGNRDLNESRINVDSLLDLLAKGTQTGFAQPEITALQRFYQAGFDKNYKVKEIADKELFLSLTNKMIGPLVKQLGQNPTDRDLNFIIEASPTLGKTVEGNRLILMAMKESQNRARLRAAL
jgi:hypothetical protein